MGVNEDVDMTDHDVCVLPGQGSQRQVDTLPDATRRENAGVDVAGGAGATTGVGMTCGATVAPARVPDQGLPVSYTHLTLPTIYSV